MAGVEPDPRLPVRWDAGQGFVEIPEGPHGIPEPQPDQSASHPQARSPLLGPGFPQEVFPGSSELPGRHVEEIDGLEEVAPDPGEVRSDFAVGSEDLGVGDRRVRLGAGQPFPSQVPLSRRLVLGRQVDLAQQAERPHAGMELFSVLVVELGHHRQRVLDTPSRSQGPLPILFEHEAAEPEGPLPGIGSGAGAAGSHQGAQVHDAQRGELLFPWFSRSLSTTGGPRTCRAPAPQES